MRLLRCRCCALYLLGIAEQPPDRALGFDL